MRFNLPLFGDCCQHKVEIQRLVNKKKALNKQALLKIKHIYRLVDTKHSVYPKDMSVHKSMKIQNMPQNTKLPLSLLPQNQGSAPLNSNL